MVVRIVISILVLASLLGCGKPKLEVAQPCYVVRLDEASAIQVSNLHEDFALAHGLKRNESYHFMMVWDKKVAERWEAEIFFHRVVGKPSAMFMFAYDDESRAVLRPAYQQFLEEKIKPRWGGQLCGEVPGFKLPVSNRR